MQHIPLDEVDFHAHSYGDPDGRLFSWNGELYRGISHAKTPLFRDLFRKGILQKLIEQGILVHSEPVALKLEGYGMIVHHRRIPFVSYPHEWCAAMFRDAGVAYLDWVEELGGVGLTLKDTHPWNVLFDGCRPVYVDLTSIKPFAENSLYVNDDKFYHYYIYPLLLMSEGQERIVRYLLPDYEGISPANIALLTQKGARLPSKSLTRRIASALERGVPGICRGPLKSGLRSARGFFEKDSQRYRSPLESVRRLKDELANIPLPLSRDSQANWLPRSSWLATESELEKIIMELSPRSILVIGKNLPDLTKLNGRARSSWVCFDANSNHISRLYYHGSEKKLPLLPLVIDFTDPTPSRGLASHISIAATERLQCDMVIAPGLVNRVVSERYLRFDQIVEGLAQFAKRWLITNFVPLEAAEQKSRRFAWYTRENFVHALQKKFSNIRIASVDSSHDGLLVCEK